jgi:hypothetical protein
MEHPSKGGQAMTEDRMPYIRVSVEHVKQQIIHALSVHLDEYNETVKRMVAEAVGSVDIEKTVRHTLETIPWEDHLKDAIRKTAEGCVKSYFLYGRGYSVIQEAVEAMMPKEDKDVTNP